MMLRPVLKAALPLLAAPLLAVAQPRSGDATAAAATGKAASAPAAPARAPKAAVDDRAAARLPASEVGEGTRLGRKRLAPGAYIGPRHRSAVAAALASQRPSGPPVKWQIGEPLPPGVPLVPVWKPVLLKLPMLPPGHIYAQLGGDVVLVALESRMVVDGVSRAAR